MGYKLTRKLPKDFPNTIPDLITINGVDIRTDLMVDCFYDIGINPKKAHEIIAFLLAPEWSEE